MKKSEQYSVAMKEIIDDRDIAVPVKIEILATLMADQRLAVYSEECAAERAEEAESK